MTSGGARARSGPAPDPGSLSADLSGWVVLPVTGRVGPPPVWPLTDATERELEHWHRLWVKPQATEWERLDLVVDVGLYVRRLVEVEQPGASSAAANHVIRLSEALGLTTAGMRVNRWYLGKAAVPMAPAVGDDQPAAPRRRARPAGTRGRLKVVPADGER